VVVGSGRAAVQLINPEPGWVEIHPDSLWEKVLQVRVFSKLKLNIPRNKKMTGNSFFCEMFLGDLMYFL